MTSPEFSTPPSSSRDESHFKELIETINALNEKNIALEKRNKDLEEENAVLKDKLKTNDTFTDGLGHFQLESKVKWCPSTYSCASFGRGFVLRFPTIVALVGAAATILLTFCTHTVHESLFRHPRNKWLGAGCGAAVFVLNFLLCVYLPCIKSWQWIQRGWGNVIQSLISLITLYLSAVPSMIHQVDESSVLPMLALPIWALGIELGLDPGTNIGLLSLCLGISVSLAATYMQYWASKVVMVLPLLHTFLYQLLMPSKKSIMFRFPKNNQQGQDLFTRYAIAFEAMPKGEFKKQMANRDQSLIYKVRSNDSHLSIPFVGHVLAPDTDGTTEFIDVEIEEPDRSWLLMNVRAFVNSLMGTESEAPAPTNADPNVEIPPAV